MLKDYRIPRYHSKPTPEKYFTIFTAQIYSPL